MLSVYITFLITLIHSGNANEEVFNELEWAQNQESTFYRDDLANHLIPTNDPALRRFRSALLQKTEKKLIREQKGV